MCRAETSHPISNGEPIREADKPTHRHVDRKAKDPHTKDETDDDADARRKILDNVVGIPDHQTG